MPEITTLFWDIGGVVLTNAWDHAERSRAIAHFQLDGGEFEARHEEVDAAFETRRITLGQYLDRTVFYQPRSFSTSDFIEFMCAQSKPCPEVLHVVAELAASKRYSIGTINNESLDLNRYRIRKFELAKYFTVFCSSCFLGVRKPAAGIYSLALELTGRMPGECVFIDDRRENLECPRNMGMHVVHYESPERLRRELEKYGVGN